VEEMQQPRFLVQCQQQESPSLLSPAACCDKLSGACKEKERSDDAFFSSLFFFLAGSKMAAPKAFGLRDVQFITQYMWDPRVPSELRLVALFLSIHTDSSDGKLFTTVTHRHELVLPKP
jgi:hypothetical protein